MGKKVSKKGASFYRNFGGKRFELYQENPVRKTIANSVAEEVRELGGKARVIENSVKGYYIVYAREIRG